jgi:hypothetical protein
MSSRNAVPPSTANPPGPDNTNETTPPSPQEISEVAQRILASLTEEKRTHIRNAVMRTMSEEQRLQATATNKDPLMQFIFHKAQSEILNRDLPGRVDIIDIRQQLREQHQRLPPDQLQALIARQRGMPPFSLAMLADLMTQRSHDGVELFAATAATSSLEAGSAADVPLHAGQQCANCGSLANQRSTSLVDSVDEQGKESPPFNYCSKNCQREHSTSAEPEDGGGSEEASSRTDV